MKEKQLLHDQVKFNHTSKVEVNILLDIMHSPANLGSIFRNAEAFGVSTIWIHQDNEKDLQSNRFKRTSRSTESRLNVLFYTEFASVINNNNHTKIGLEITNTSQPLKWIKNLNFENILLVLGNEKQGIHQDVLEHLDYTYHIEMYGTNSSLNVSQSLGIALYEIRRPI